MLSTLMNFNMLRCTSRTHFSVFIFFNAGMKSRAKKKHIKIDSFRWLDGDDTKYLNNVKEDLSWCLFNTESIDFPFLCHSTTYTRPAFVPSVRSHWVRARERETVCVSRFATTTKN